MSESNQILSHFDVNNISVAGKLTKGHNFKEFNRNHACPKEDDLKINPAMMDPPSLDPLPPKMGKNGPAPTYSASVCFAILLYNS